MQIWLQTQYPLLIANNKQKRAINIINDYNYANKYIYRVTSLTKTCQVLKKNSG